MSELNPELTKDEGHPLNDDFVYALQDLLGPILRAAKKRARKHNQNMAAESIDNMSKQTVEIGSRLIKSDAAAEAAGRGAPVRGRPPGSTNKKNGGYDEGDNSEHY